MTDVSSKEAPKANKPFYQRPWFIVLAVLVLISSITNALNKDENSTSTPQATVTVTAEPTSTASQTPVAKESKSEASPMPEETVNVDSDFNIANFRSSATNNLADLKKDLGDLKKRAEEGSLLRLLGNVLEISFNQGQLSALTDVPTKIAKTWPAEIAKLEAAVDALSDKTSAYVSGEISLSALKDAIGKVNSIAGKLEGLAGKL
jgi:chromosomal replication initiation ATPase DnaA